MDWVTRRRIRVNRAATIWLVKRFVDPSAAFHFVDDDAVAPHQAAHGSQGFDAPGALWPHADAKGRCSFEQIVQRHCWSDLALREMGKIVGAADFPARLDESAEAPGLRAICSGFPDVCADDHETVERSAIVFDALYATLSRRFRASPE